MPKPSQTLAGAIPKQESLAVAGTVVSAPPSRPPPEITEAEIVVTVDDRRYVGIASWSNMLLLRNARQIFDSMSDTANYLLIDHPTATYRLGAKCVMRIPMHRIAQTYIVKDKAWIDRVR